METKLTREAKDLLDHIFDMPCETWFDAEQFIVCDDGRYRHLIRISDVNEMVENVGIPYAYVDYSTFCEWVPAVVNGTDSRQERCRQLAALRHELSKEDRRNLCNDLFLLD